MMVEPKQMDGPFVYQPLSFAESRPLRILRLIHNSDKNARIVCELDHVSLDNPPQYEALSYTWEDPSLPVSPSPPTILLHGHLHRITPNLDLALRRLRLPSRDRRLWVDAICIDQSSVLEKNQQVPLMRDIYCFTSLVLVWLGEERTANMAITFLDQIIEASEAGTTFSLINDWDAEWAAAEELFARHWFTRAWILQEVIHQNDVLVHIGDLTPIPIDTLCAKWNAYRLMLSFRTTFKTRSAENRPEEEGTTDAGHLSVEMWIRVGAKVEDIRDTILFHRETARDPSRRDVNGNPSYPPRLAPMLMRTREQVATNPLDKIYSLIGIAPGYDIPIDYNMSKGNLYSLVTRQLLKNVLLVLLWIDSPERPVPSGDQDLPSWVPDFTTKQTFISRTLHSNYIYFRADTNFPSLPSDILEPRLLSPPDSKILILRGILIGVITWRQNTRFTNDVDLEGEDSICLIKYDLNQTSTEDVRTANSSTSRNQEPARTWHNTSWSSVNTFVGDVIVISPKCQLPLVLRPTGDGEYLFVGVCWLIDSRIKDISTLHSGEDPGFSRIMYDGVCNGIDRSSDVQNFCIR